MYLLSDQFDTSASGSAPRPIRVESKEVGKTRAEEEYREPIDRLPGAYHGGSINQPREVRSFRGSLRMEDSPAAALKHAPSSGSTAAIAIFRLKLGISSYRQQLPHMHHCHI